MLLREWLQELGYQDRTVLDFCRLENIRFFRFNEDAYSVHMLDEHVYQDNDLERLLSVIRDEFRVFNTTVTLKNAGLPRGPAIEYPFLRGKPCMLVRPVVWNELLPMPDIDAVVNQLRMNVTYFNISGSFQPPMNKDNL